jgi:hypothetical protein
MPSKRFLGGRFEHLGGGFRCHARERKFFIDPLVHSQQIFNQEGPDASFG